MSFLTNELGTNMPKLGPVADGIRQVGDFPPTPEQVAIVRAALDTDDNLRVDALAGTGKTSTLVLLANQPTMQKIATLVLAFNVSIKKEMEAKLPSNCFASTLNGLGHRTWAKFIGKRVRPSTGKNGDILKAYINEQPKALQEALWASFADITKLLRDAKSAGFLPDGLHREPPLRLWPDEDEYFLSLPEEPEPYEWDALIECLRRSVELAFTGDIDFDDQIIMPTLYRAKWPMYPLVMVDEAQDLSTLNHEMLKQLIGEKGRLIAVGDPCQAIYAFRGARNDSMERLTSTFNLQTYPLTTSFRCPKAVVREAQWRAPNMNAPDWAVEGEIHHLGDWEVEALPQDAVILCRNNAPIFSMAIRLLMNDRFPQVVGNDIGKTLVKALKKLGPDNMTPEEVLEAIRIYEEKRLMKAREHGKGRVKDFCACLRLFVPKGDTLKDMCAYVDYLLQSTGPVRLMTMHKSKGLEFPHVFILDRHLCRIEQEGGQDHNLLYVAQTRAQRVLTYIESERFISAELETEDD